MVVKGKSLDYRQPSSNPGPQTGQLEWKVEGPRRGASKDKMLGQIEMRFTFLVGSLSMN